MKKSVKKQNVYSKMLTSCLTELRDLALEPGKLLAAVNQSIVPLDTEVKAGDEVAFFPPAGQTRFLDASLFQEAEELAAKIGTKMIFPLVWEKCNFIPRFYFGIKWDNRLINSSK